MLRLSEYVRRARYVLPALVLLHWVCVAIFALSVRHNGWVWYQGGDQIWYVTSGWMLGNGDLPPARIGYGWPLLLAPITFLTGSGFVAAMPYVIALNVLLLAPVAIGCVFWIGRYFAGPVAGLWAALLWIVIPYAAIPLFRDDYHERFVEQFLPQALGLSGLADYPSMVFLLGAAVLVLRTLSSRGPTDAVLAGAVAGFAVAMKPANLLFLLGPGLAFLAARRLGSASAFAAGLVPSLVALAVWKARGLGSVPLFAFEETRLAAGAALGGLSLERYTDLLDWDTFRTNMAGLREWFWSARLLQFAPFAGVIAVARSSPPLAGLLGGWFFAIALVKGATPESTVESGSFFRLLMPAFPAYLLLLAFIPALVPTLLRRFDGDSGRMRTPLRVPVAVAALAATLVALPVVAFADPIGVGEKAVLINTILTPVDFELAPVVSSRGEGQTLAWDAPQTGPTNTFFRVYRTSRAEDEFRCEPHDGAAECALTMIELGTTREPRFTDGSPPPGVRYRVGLAANWLDDPGAGDVFRISPAVRGR
jgi:hypothetical protein